MLRLENKVINVMVTRHQIPDAALDTTDGDEGYGLRRRDVDADNIPNGPYKPVRCDGL